MAHGYLRISVRPVDQDRRRDVIIGRPSSAEFALWQPFEIPSLPDDDRVVTPSTGADMGANVRRFRTGIDGRRTLSREGARVGTKSVGGVMPIERVVGRTPKSRGYVQPVMYSSLCADTYRSP